MEPTVEDRRLGDDGGGQYGPETGTSVGETGQLRLGASADGREVPADQLLDVGIGFGDGCENLPPSSLRLDIADPDLQMPFVLLTAADEGRNPR